MTKMMFNDKQIESRYLHSFLKNRGIWIRVPAFILPVAPALTVTKDQVDQISTAIDESIGELEKEIS